MSRSGLDWYRLSSEKPLLFSRAVLCAVLLPTALSLLPGCVTAGGNRASVLKGTASKQAHFTDVTQSAGLNYQWAIAGSRPLNILQTIGNGCAFLDYDNDGNLDILLVGPKMALYRGNGKGKFTAETHRVGMDKLSGHFLGCAVGDYDNDGFDDIYLSGYRTGILLHNESAGKSETDAVRVFRDVTQQAGLKPQPWGTSCAFCETRPGSGRLDLYVANYARFNPATDPKLCTDNGVLTSCGPVTYAPIQGVLYLNDGAGRFHDATAATQLNTAAGRGLGVGFMDYDGSGTLGLAIANDEIPGDLFQPQTSKNKQQVQYLNAGISSGTGLDNNGNVHGGMGLDWGDYDNDGKPDLFVMTYQNEPKCLYHNEGSGIFRNMSVAAGLESCTPLVAFGCKFLDYDNDGLLDAVIANGHVLDNTQKIRPNSTYRQTAQLLHNRGAGIPRFEDVSTPVGGTGFTKPIVGRGAAIGDFDNDGRMDILLVDSEDTPLLLHNDAGDPRHHFLNIKLVGTHSNRDGYGAVITAAFDDGHKIVRVCHADGSYLSSSDRRVHLGLGAAQTVAILTVKWSGGHIDSYKAVAVDRGITLHEGDSIIP